MAVGLYPELGTLAAPSGKGRDVTVRTTEFAGYGMSSARHLAIRIENRMNDWNVIKIACSSTNFLVIDRTFAFGASMVANSHGLREGANGSPRAGRSS